MKPSRHLAVSFSLAAAVWYLTKSLPAGILCLIFGIMIDIDHIIEYIIHYGWKGFTFEKFFQTCEQTQRQEGERRFKKAYLIFHVGEIAILLWAISIYTKNIYILAVALGYSVHLLMDYIGNRLCLGSCFITGRIVKKFDSEKLFRNSKRS